MSETLSKIKTILIIILVLLNTTLFVGVYFSVTRNFEYANRPIPAVVVYNNLNIIVGFSMSISVDEDYPLYEEDFESPIKYNIDYAESWFSIEIFPAFDLINNHAIEVDNISYTLNFTTKTILEGYDYSILVYGPKENNEFEHLTLIQRSEIHSNYYITFTDYYILSLLCIVEHWENSIGEKNNE